MIIEDDGWDVPAALPHATAQEATLTVLPSDRPLPSGQPARAGCSAFFAREVVEALADDGLDRDALLQGATIPRATLTQNDARIPNDAFIRLWELAIAQAGYPAVGLRPCLEPRPDGFGIVGYAMMSAPDLGELLDRLQRYVQIIHDAARIAVARDERGLRCVLSVTGIEPIWQASAFGLLRLLSLCRWLTRRDLRPVCLELAFPVPHEDVSAWVAGLGFPCRFDAPETALQFSPADTAMALRTADPVIAEITDRLARQRLDELLQGPISRRVQALICRRLADGKPPRAPIAAELAMSPRTLVRRLAEEGTSFRQILDATRRDCAEEFIQDRQLSLADAAYLLGFSDQSGFFRAYRRWFGAPPRARRRPDLPSFTGSGRGS